MFKVSHSIREFIIENMSVLSEKDTLLRLYRACLRYRKRLLAATATLLLLAATRLYLTWLVKEWAEGPLVNADSSSVHRIMTAAVITTGIMVAAIFLSRYMTHDVNQRMVQGLRDRAQQKLIQIGVAGVRRFQSGDLFSRIFNDVSTLSLFVRDIFKRVIGESLLAIGAFGMMLYLDWRLAVLMCAVVPPVAVILSGLTKIIRRWAGKAQCELGILSAAFSEQLHGITTIKGFQAEEFEESRFSELNRNYRRQFMRSELWSAILMANIWLVTGLGLLSMMWYGSQQVLAGQLTAGELIAFCLCAGQLVEPVRKLSDVYAGLQRSLAAAERVFEIIDSVVSEQDGNIVMHHPVTGNFCFDQVHFQYQRGEKVLENVTLSVSSGVTTALVSQSGGGKSTIAKLAVRFWDPLKGHILVDGADIRALRLEDLRSTVCVVEQEPFIFSGPLRENICYGSWHAPRAAIETAVKFAGLEELVFGFPHGLDTHLEEGGHSLSGGQKQRIALARAIVRNPAILILDEATSAIDSDTERQIFERLEDWLGQRTVIVMAHRLSTIRRFDRIIVLDGGRVIGDGALNELITSCSPFHQLFSEQLVPMKPQI